jgi:hypothetical protein
MMGRFVPDQFAYLHLRIIESTIPSFKRDQQLLLSGSITIQFFMAQ